MDEAVCYLNGEFVVASAAKVSIFDRGFTSGEGVYDVTRSFGHKLFKFDQHIARLFRSLKYARIDCGMSSPEMTRLSIEVFERNKPLMDRDDDCALWQVVSRGVDRFAKGKPVRATVAIFCLPIAYHNFARDYIEGCILVTPSTRRTPPQSLEAKAKITNKMNHTVAAFEARQVHPRATPLMLDMDGNISETHLGNFFFVHDGKLCTSTARTVLTRILAPASPCMDRIFGRAAFLISGLGCSPTSTNCLTCPLPCLDCLRSDLSLPEDTFSSRFKKPMNWLRLLHYPPQGSISLEEAIGTRAHTDTSALTILALDDVAGLQVFTKDGSWVPVRRLDETLVINTGEIMKPWTGGIFMAARHRVINQTGRGRYSVPFFATPSFDEVLKPLMKNPSTGDAAPEYHLLLRNNSEVVCGDFLQRQYSSIYPTG